MEILIFLAGFLIGGFFGILIEGLAVAASRGDTPPKNTLTPEQHKMITDAFKKGQTDGANNVRVLREEDQEEG